MSLRNSVAEVKTIIDTTLDDEQITPFMKTANVLIAEVLAGAGYSDDLLDEIELWLTAHFIAIRDPRAARERVDNTEVHYQGKTGEGLSHTSYGQQVLILDIKGKFTDLIDGKGSATVETIA